MATITIRNLALRQEDERNAKLPGVVALLGASRGRIRAGALRFQGRRRSALPIAELMVGPRTVRQRVFVQHTRTIRQIPGRVLEQCVDLDAREGSGLRPYARAASLSNGSRRSSKASLSITSILKKTV